MGEVTLVVNSLLCSDAHTLTRNRAEVTHNELCISLRIAFNPRGLGQIKISLQRKWESFLGVSGLKERYKM